MENTEMKVPDGWQTKVLGEILRYEQPYRYSVSSTDYDDKSGIPVLTAGKSFILGYTTETEGIYNNLPVIIFDDFTTDSKYVDFPFKVKSSAMKFLMPKDAAVTDLKLIFGHIQRLKIRETGGDHKRRWISDFSKLKIHLPLPAEQRQIARILSKVDEAISQTEQLLAKYRRLKTGLMQDLLTKGIDEHGNIRSEETHTFKDSPLGRIPVEWEVDRYDAFCEKVSVGIATSSSSFFVEDGVTFLRNQNIKENHISLHDVLFISRFFSEQNKNKKLKAGDIITVRTGYPGVSAVVPPELEGSQTFTTLISRPIREKALPEYLCLFLNSSLGKNQIKNLQGGGAQQNLNSKALSRLVAAVPSPLEQKKVIDLITHKERIILVELNQVAKLQSLKTGLMQDLLSGKVRVSQLIRETADV